MEVSFSSTFKRVFKKRIKGNTNLETRFTKFAEQGLLSKRLATIDINAPIDFDDHNFELEGFDREALIAIFNDLEFRTLAASVLTFDKKNLSGAGRFARVIPRADGNDDPIA